MGYGRNVVSGPQGGKQKRPVWEPALTGPRAMFTISCEMINCGPGARALQAGVADVEALNDLWSMILQSKWVPLAGTIAWFYGV